VLVLRAPPDISIRVIGETRYGRVRPLVGAPRHAFQQESNDLTSGAAICLCLGERRHGASSRTPREIPCRQWACPSRPSWLYGMSLTTPVFKPREPHPPCEYRQCRSAPSRAVRGHTQHRPPGVALDRRQDAAQRGLCCHLRHKVAAGESITWPTLRQSPFNLNIAVPPRGSVLKHKVATRTEWKHKVAASVPSTIIVSQVGPTGCLD
jgi:hypothetical protein